MKNRSRFFTSFILTFLLLAIPFGILIYYYEGKQPTPMLEDYGEMDFSGEAFSLFTGLLDDESGLSGLYILHFTPEERKITLVNIPLQLQIDYNGSLWRIDELSNAVGEKAMCNILGEALGADTPQYALFDRKGLTQFVDSIGKITYDLPVPVLTDSGATALEAGVQQLDATRLLLLLSSSAYSNATPEGVERTAELYRGGLAYRLPYVYQEDLELIFNLLANNSINNLSYQHFHTLKASLYYLASPETRVEIYSLLGQYISEGESFIPTAESLAYIKSFFAVSRETLVERE